MTVNLIKTKIVEQTPTFAPNKTEKPKESLKPNPNSKMLPAGMPENINPQMLGEALQNPELIKQFMSPNFMTNMMNHNAHVKEILNKNPELVKIL